MVEFDSVLDNPFRGSSTVWEGDIAEILVCDSALSERELKGVEEYLRQKWISGVNSVFSFGDNFSGVDSGVDMGVNTVVKTGVNSCVYCN